LLFNDYMTRSYRARRVTRPLPLGGRSRDPAIDLRTFTCFRLVTDGEDVVALRLHRSDARMFVFARIA
jgi:hypothetical protein